MNDYCPAACDWPLLHQHLEELRAGQPILRPSYDFVTHCRAPSMTFLQPTPMLLVEGILALADRHIRTLADLSISVEAPAETRLQRRLRRDVGERGRSQESVWEQFTATIAPMHRIHVEPTRKYTDVILLGDPGARGLSHHSTAHVYEGPCAGPGACSGNLRRGSDLVACWHKVKRVPTFHPHRAQGAMLDSPPQRPLADGMVQR